MRLSHGATELALVRGFWENKPDEDILDWTCSRSGRSGSVDCGQSRKGGDGGTGEKGAQERQMCFFLFLLSFSETMIRC